MSVADRIVFLVDDNRDLLDSLAFMLRLEGYEVRTFESAEEFLSAEIGEDVCGCLILDVRMRAMSGLQLQIELAQRGFLLPIIFLTGHGDIDMAVEAMHRGAFDFKLKPVDAQALMPSVARALQKREEALTGVLATATEDDLVHFRALTERELQIMRAVGRGATSRIIAERLGISKKTVEHHRASAVAKIGTAVPSEIASFFARVDAYDIQPSHG